MTCMKENFAIIAKHDESKNVHLTSVINIEVLPMQQILYAQKKSEVIIQPFEGPQTNLSEMALTEQKIHVCPSPLT